MKCNQLILVAFFIKSNFMIDIFGKQMFGSCADEWLKLCKDKKKEWILKYTKQTDEQLIDEFINNPKISKDCKCLDCGKSKKDGISKSISTETTTDVVDSNTSGNSGNGNKKRRTSNKGT